MIRPPPRSPLFPYTPLFRSPVAASRATSGLVASSGSGSAATTVALNRNAPPLARSASAIASERIGAELSQALSQHARSEEHTSELQSQSNLVCRLLLEKKKT